MGKIEFYVFAPVKHRHWSERILRLFGMLSLPNRDPKKIHRCSTHNSPPTPRARSLSLSISQTLTALFFHTCLMLCANRKYRGAVSYAVVAWCAPFNFGHVVNSRTQCERNNIDSPTRHTTHTRRHVNIIIINNGFRRFTVNARSVEFGQSSRRDTAFGHTRQSSKRFPTYRPTAVRPSPGTCRPRCVAPRTDTCPCPHG